MKEFLALFQKAYHFEKVSIRFQNETLKTLFVASTPLKHNLFTNFWSTTYIFVRFNISYNLLYNTQGRKTADYGYAWHDPNSKWC